MSEQNGKVCANCRHCIRIYKTPPNTTVTDKVFCGCYCEIGGHYIGYAGCMTYWCRHWSKEREKEGAEE